MAGVTNRITLGSGDLYCVEYTGTLPDVETMCVDDNLLARVQGGATLTYTPTWYTAKDDSGKATKTVLTDEVATLATNLVTFNANVINKIVDTGTVTEDSADRTRTIKIGGVGNAHKKSYAFCFHHTDPADGDIWVQVVGQNQGEFSLSFVKDQESVIALEITALAQDTNGTLITYIEEDDTIVAG